MPYLGEPDISIAMKRGRLLLLNVESALFLGENNALS